MRAALQGHMRGAWSAWDRFWFSPEPVATMAVIRIAFGTVAALWTISLGPDVLDFFGSDGVVPEQPRSERIGLEHSWGILGWTESDGVVIGAYVLMLLASLCLIVGLGSRVAAVVVWLGLLAFTRRNPWVLNSGDGLLRILAFYIMLMPLGAALSVDRWLRTRRGGLFWDFPLRAPWAVRMLQVQLSVLYLAAVWAKVRGTTWNDGTAVSYAFRIGDIQRFALPDAITESLLLVNLMTFGTLAVELSLGILVWSRRLRPWVLLAGVALHLGIEFAVRVGFFSYAMLVLYLAFVPPEQVRAWILAARGRVVGRRRSALAPQDAPARGGAP